MNLVFNTKQISMDPGLKLRDLLTIKGYRKTVVVFLNDKKMLMKEVESYAISENDEIKVLRILSGG